MLVFYKKSTRKIWPIFVLNYIRYMYTAKLLAWLFPFAFAYCPARLDLHESGINGKLFKGTSTAIGF